MKRVFGAIFALALALPATADVFDLSWFTVDGGGATFSTGGSFSLGGTIGQPDASNELTGGKFTLIGGFWPGADSSPPCSGNVRGDSNCDSNVNFNDIDCFVASLIDKASWVACGGGAGCDYVCVNDINQDTFVNFNDIDGFVECLVGGVCP